MTWRRIAGLLALLGCVFVVGACGTDESDTADSGSEDQAAQEETQSNTGEQSKFFVREDFERQLAQREATPEGPEDKPWEQAIEPEMNDTSKFKSSKSGGYNVCFSNAAVDNPWRQVGWKTMQQEVKLHDEIAKFTSVDAEAKDDKQISDIESMVSASATR
jgi:ribose transport system substrate-binding protein